MYRTLTEQHGIVKQRRKHVRRPHYGKLELLSTAPNEVWSWDIIKLKDKDGEFRIRSGNYRIQLQKVDKGFLVTKIGKRENFYLIFL